VKEDIVEELTPVKPQARLKPPPPGSDNGTFVTPRYRAAQLFLDKLRNLKPYVELC